MAGAAIFKMVQQLNYAAGEKLIKGRFDDKLGR
jgi:hypothetical protein